MNKPGFLRLFFCIAMSACLVSVQMPVCQAAEPAANVEQSDSADLSFSFNGTPWREVIRWVADQSDLALHVGDLPPGSFTYSDSNQFTSAEAIDRINLFLLAEGYTLIRSGQLLSVINLSDPRSLAQLDVLAKQVSVEQLAEIEGTHEVVKVLFPLGEIDADEAVDELSALNLMSTPTVLSKTNQLMITDTAARLRNVRDVLAAFEPNLMENGTVVKNFALQHVDAEDVLLVARPHLGLATGEMIGIDVSLSADLQGKHIYVTGIEDKVKLIERLVESIDKPDGEAMDTDAAMELRSHLVEGGNVDVVYNVLQTLLSGKSVRLSIDHNASSIVALATSSVQREIADTVQQIQSSDAQFEVIPLKNTDPFFVITLLEQMLDLPSPLDDPEDIDPGAPKIDADPGNRRLFVRAKKHQLEQIKKIVAGLESTELPGGAALADSEAGDTMRMLPIKGRQAEQLLETATEFWRTANPVVVYPTSDQSRRGATERVPASDEETQEAADDAVETMAVDDVSDSSYAPSRPGRLTTVSKTRGPSIRCQVTTRGLLIQSEDTEALDQFERHLRSIAGPLDTMSVPPTVFYLQHTKPDDALRMLGELLDGGASARERESGTLVNGFVSGAAGGSFLSSLVSSREGTTTMMAGSITVVADSRLNRLIAQGTPEDIDQIEDYLKIIDKDQSITSIETHGVSRIIELQHTRAAEIADAIREAFIGRIKVEPRDGKGGPSSLKGDGPIDPREAYFAARESGGSDRNDKKSSKKEKESQPASDLEPKMTVAVHEPSNSLIVTAPQALFEEAEALAQRLDARGEQTVEVVAPLNSEVYGLLLQQLTSGESASANRSSSGKTSSSSTSTSKKSSSTRSTSRDR